MPAASPRQAGLEAEAQALAYLQQQGLQLLARNWLCKGGELDLVMLDGDTVVFVEVRYRLHAQWGGALESIDARKVARVVNAAHLYLHKEARWANHPCRFDVIALEGTASKDMRLNWLRNAFES
ncbi:YraN family protein [Pseudomonas silvicola]|nr:YraN family protein [Pseudomonas silvicola]